MKTVTRKPWLLITPLIISALFCSHLCGDTLIWNDGDPQNHLWNSPDNWDLNRTPTASDTAEIRTGPANNPLIDNTVTDAQCYLLIIGKVPGTMATLDVTGGQLYCAYKSNIGRGNNCDGILNISAGQVTLNNTCDIGYDTGSRGVLNISGGTLIFNRHLFVGGNGSGTLNMTGGVIDGTTEELHVPWSATGSGQVHLHAGTVTFGSLTMNANGRIDITAGTLIIEGDQQTLINGYVTNNWITAYNGDRNVNVFYNGTNTIVTASQDMLLETCMDDDFFASRTNLDFELHPPIPRDVVIEFNQPWEQGIGAWPVIFWDSDEDIYRMYYRAGNAAAGPVCYAYSPDGISWTKPGLYFFAWQGNADNNIIFEDALAFFAFKDPNPNCAPDALYKALVIKETLTPPVGLTAEELDWWNQGWRWAVYAYKSSGALWWNPMQSDPVLIHGAFDTQNSVFWDSSQNKYVCFSAEYRNVQGQPDRDGLDIYRQIQLRTSDDFINWSSPVWLDLGSLPLTHFGSFNIMPYPQTSQLYFGLPQRFVFSRQTQPGYPVPTADHLAHASSVLFMSARDHTTWHCFPQAYMRPGLGPEKWTQPEYNNTPAHGMVVTANDLVPDQNEWSFYVNETVDVAQGVSGLRRCTVRPQGFVSLYAPLAGGELITEPFILQWPALYLNYATSAAGGIRVEIQDASGVPIPGYTLADSKNHFRDYLKHAVQWEAGSDLSSLLGTTIQLRLVAKDAHLYGIFFE